MFWKRFHYIHVEDSPSSFSRDEMLKRMVTRVGEKI